MANEGSSSLDRNDSLSSNGSGAFDASCYAVSSADEQVMTSIRVFVGASLLFVASGLVGNTLSVLVFSSAEMRQMSSNVYLLALAVSDSVYLVSVLLGRLLTAARCWYFAGAAPLDLVNHSQFFCVFQQYLSDLFADYSTCLILAFTVERGYAVFFPVEFKHRCTVTRARVVCAAMFAVIGSCIAPYHAIMIGLYTDFNVCAIIKKHEEVIACLSDSISLYSILLDGLMTYRLRCRTDFPIKWLCVRLAVESLCSNRSRQVVFFTHLPLSLKTTIWLCGWEGKCTSGVLPATRYRLNVCV